MDWLISSDVYKIKNKKSCKISYMEDNTLLVSVMAIVVLIVVGVGCWAYRNGKKNQSTYFLERFLCMFSHSFHEARWVYIELHQEIRRTDEEIITKIMDRIREDMKNECMLFFDGCTIFPKDYRKTDLEEETVINFIDGMLPTIKRLQLQYRKKRISVEDLKTEFFAKIQEFLLSEMKKDHLLHIQKQ